MRLSGCTASLSLCGVARNQQRQELRAEYISKSLHPTLSLRRLTRNPLSRRSSTIVNSVPELINRDPTKPVISFSRKRRPMLWNLVLCLFSFHPLTWTRTVCQTLFNGTKSATEVSVERGRQIGQNKGVK